MLATTLLAQQLKQFNQLDCHRSAPVRQMLGKVEAWQKDHLLAVHEDLFSQPQFERLAGFLVEHVYHHANMMQLAQQLDKALQEKIKLDRFLPKHVLEAAILAFELAYLTLNLDEQVAQYLIDHSLTANTQHIQQAMIALDQLSNRQRQLQLLFKLSCAFNQYARGFFIQSAFRLAKSTAYRRQFNFLYDYLSHAFGVIRSSPQNSQFFKLFISQESLFLMQFAQGATLATAPAS